jgi:aspartyl-tRNA(Asn)/glutamyl-tRNA(Gln) amidotransferase subunit B
MISEEIRKKYTATIGIECHVQFNTKTKLFAPVDNDARDVAPNTLVSEICFGMPGALPVLNEEAVRKAIIAGKALGTHAQLRSVFDRKHYFYPDLPKGYQITQLHEPIILGGEVYVTVNGEKKRIGITRAHMEEDAGKSTHPEGADYSLVDLNRAGTPLLEIVSDPDIHDSETAKAYARELWLLMRYSGVSDADLFYGNMRFDVNVSVSTTNELGTRAEVKNLNSFRSVQRATDFEIERQIERLEKGESIVQETRGWNDAKQKTFSQRIKENSDDYRYFPDPDIPPIILTPEHIAKVEIECGLLPDDVRKMLHSMIGTDIEKFEPLIEEIEPIKTLFYVASGSGVHIKVLADWFIGIIRPLVQDKKIEWKKLRDETGEMGDTLSRLVDMVIKNQINSSAAKEILTKILLGDVSDPFEHAKENGLLQQSDNNALESWVSQVLEANPKAVADIQAGELKVIGFLVGSVMKLSKGSANPAMVQDIIKKQLGV